MKKFILTTIVLLSVGLAMVLVGSVLQGINWSTADFNGDPLASALTTIGYLVAVLSGVVLTGLGVSTAILGNCKKENEKKGDEK